MKKLYDDDDGRTVADMSGVDRQSVMSGLFVGLRFSGGSGKKQRETGADSPEQQVTLKKKERKGYIFGAMSAALVIGLIILAVFALAIVIILWIGGVL